jgi:hypothetical protein
MYIVDLNENIIPDTVCVKLDKLSLGYGKYSILKTVVIKNIEYEIVQSFFKNTSIVLKTKKK